MTRPMISLHGRAVQYDNNFIYLDGRPIGMDSLPPLRKGATRWFVDSAVDGEGGRNQDEAFGTLDEAINVSSEYDQILVMEGHSEAITSAAAIDIDVNGIGIYGFGAGSNQATVTFGNTAATIEVNADDVVICGLHFQATVTGVVAGIDIVDGSEHGKLVGCRFSAETLGTDEFVDAIVVTTSDRWEIAHNVFDMDEAGAASAIHLVGACLKADIHHNMIEGDYSVACIEGITAAAEHVYIYDNTLVNGVHGGLNTLACINLFTGSTGYIYDNRLYCNVATPDLSVVADGCFLIDNRYCETAASADEFLYTPKAPDDANNFIGVDDSNNVAATTNVAANRDGSILERLEAIYAAQVDDGTTNALGVDDADNAFDSSNVAANEDGSILERLEQVQEAVNNGTGTAVATNTSLVDYIIGSGAATGVAALGTKVSKTGAVLTAADDLFTVTGKCLVLLAHGEMVTAETAATTSLTVKLNTKTAGVDICAATAVISDGAGTLYMISGDQDDTMNGSDTPTASHAQLGDANGWMPFIVDSDTIESTVAIGGGTPDGTLTWDLWYIPLESGASIAAAA